MPFMRFLQTPIGFFDFPTFMIIRMCEFLSHLIRFLIFPDYALAVISRDSSFVIALDFGVIRVRVFVFDIEYKVHAYNRNGLCAVGFMDDHYPVRSAFSLLNQVSIINVVPPMLWFSCNLVS